MKQTIYLAGGCFWGVDAYFKNIEGVVETEAGYANGKTTDTFYENLKNTDHAETVKVTYDDSLTSLSKLLEYFYYIVDPFSIDKQGADTGRQYRTGIYATDKNTLEEVESFIEDKQKDEDKKIQIEVEEIKNYIKAEEYHQDYLKKNPNGYCHVNLLDVPEV